MTSRRAPPPPKGPKIHRILHEFRSKFWQSTATHCASKTKKKNGGRSVLYLLLWGERLRRQSTGYSLSLQNSKKKWRALRPVFLALGGASPQAEYWLRNDAMPDASQQKKNAPLKHKKTGVPPCPLYFVGCRKSGRVQAGSQRRRRSLDLEIPRHGGGLALAPLDIYIYIYIYIY